jgi:hypothetical protein
VGKTPFKLFEGEARRLIVVSKLACSGIDRNAVVDEFDYIKHRFAKAS